MTEASLDDFAGTLVLLGAGKMGGAMLEGWRRLGLKFDNAAVIEPQPTPEIMALGQRGLRINPALDTIAAAAVVIAVKPQSAPQALPAIKPVIRDDTVVISIMAGRTLAFLEKALPGAALVRAMRRRTSALIRLDFPTFDRPTSANSGMRSPRKSPTPAALRTKEASTITGIANC